MTLAILLACNSEVDAQRFDALETETKKLGADVDRLETQLSELEAQLAEQEARREPRPRERSIVREAGPPLELTCVDRGDGVFAFDKGWEEAAEDPSRLLSTIRIVPHLSKGGVADGFRLSAIRPDTLYTCGFRNGDILQAVNGMPVTTMDELTKAFLATEDAGEWTFSVSRRDAPQQWTIRSAP